MSKIEIEKSELDNLIKEGIAKALEKKDTPSIRRRKEEKTKVFLRKVDDKYIVDLDKKITKKIDPETKREILYSYVYLGEERKKKLMSFDDIKTSEKVDVIVLEKKVKNEEIIGEPIPIIVHEDWRQRKAGTFAENLVIIPHTTFRVKTPEGELEVEDNIVNLN